MSTSMRPRPLLLSKVSSTRPAILASDSDAGVSTDAEEDLPMLTISAAAGAGADAAVGRACVDAADEDALVAAEGPEPRNT